VRLWDLERGKLLSAFQAHRTSVAAVALTPDAALTFTAAFGAQEGFR